MEQLEGKYFENTINKLQEAKDAERIEMRAEFKANLRAGLVDKIGVLPMKPDWSEAILRWKYFFGAVPALAVLTIVAANVANLQVKMPAPELIPQNIGQQNVSPNAPTNTVTEAVENNQSQPVVNSGIVTFSSALVMPPADVLEKLREEQNPSQSDVSTSADIQSVQPVDNGSQQLNFLNDLNTQIKLNPPKVDLFTFDFQNSGANNNLTSAVDSNVLPLPANIPAQIIQTGPSVVVIPVDNNAAVADNSLRVENNGKVEDAQKVESPAVLNQNVQTVPAIENNNAQTNVAVPTAAMENIAAPVKIVDASVPTETNNLVPTAASPSMPNLNDVTATSADSVAAPTSAEVKMDTYVNPATEAMTKAVDTNLNNVSTNVAMPMIASPTVLDVSRIAYDGNDKPLVNALVLRELADRNGNLSSDYAVNVKKLTDGKLKISLFEFGKVKRIIFMEKDAKGQYKTVTVINY